MDALTPGKGTRSRGSGFPEAEAPRETPAFSPTPAPHPPHMATQPSVRPQRLGSMAFRRVLGTRGPHSPGLCASGPSRWAGTHWSAAARCTHCTVTLVSCLQGNRRGLKAGLSAPFPNRGQGSRGRGEGLGFPGVTSNPAGSLAGGGQLGGEAVGVGAPPRTQYPFVRMRGSHEAACLPLGLSCSGGTPPSWSVQKTAPVSNLHIHIAICLQGPRPPGHTSLRPPSEMASLQLGPPPQPASCQALG